VENIGRKAVLSTITVRILQMMGLNEQTMP
jgi:cAMP-specific phosphodiesterase 4